MTQIILKSKNVPGSVPLPTNLVPGELAFNTADLKLFCLSADSLSVVELAGSGYAPLASPALTGTPTAPTPATADNSTTIATTAYVQAQNYAVALATTPGTYTKVTVTAQGLVSSGTNLVNTDIPKTLDHTWITDFDTQVRTSTLNQMALPTAAVNMNGQLVSNVATPVSAGDAANKSYVDSMSQGLNVQTACVCASTPAGGNITLSGLQTIDGYTTVAGDRVLVKDQTDPTTNGVYAANTAAWTRTTDFDSSSNILTGSYFLIEKGSTNAGTGWVMNTPAPITVGTTPLNFVQYSTAGSYQADGNGIILTGNMFSLVGVPGEITTSPSGIGIDPSYAMNCGTFMLWLAMGLGFLTSLGVLGT